MEINGVTLLSYKQAQNQENKPLSTDSKCLICLENFTDDSGLIAKVEACGAYYHAECLRLVLQKSRRSSQNIFDAPRFLTVIECPHCRVGLRVGEVRETSG